MSAWRNRAIGRVLAVLRRLDRPHALIGGWAVIVWGYLRTSEDIDILIDLPASRRRELLATVPRSADSFPVDMLPVRGSADRGALSRAVAVTVEGISIPAVSAEDLIAMKLEASCRERRALDRLALIRR